MCFEKTVGLLIVLDFGPDFFSLCRCRQKVAISKILFHLEEKPARLDICLGLIRLELDFIDRAADQVLQGFAD